MSNAATPARAPAMVAAGLCTGRRGCDRPTAGNTSLARRCAGRGNARRCRGGRATVWGALLLAPLALGACQRATPAATSAPALAISTKTPEDAARSLLGLLRAQLQAAARQERAVVAQLRQTALDHLVAREDILRHVSGAERLSEQEQSELFHKLVDSWAAAIAYYADGLALDQLKALGATAGTRAADLVLPARGPDDTALLHVYCQRTPGNEWRVAGLELVPSRTPATAPATAPGV